MTKVKFTGAKLTAWKAAVMEIQGKFRQQGFGCWHANPCFHVNPNASKQLPGEALLNQLVPRFFTHQGHFWSTVRSDDCSWCRGEGKPCVRFEFLSAS